jgi:exoribonuclease II
MEPGTIVEYIDRQRIMCAVVLEVKNQRLRLLTETHREVKLSANRLLFLPGASGDLSAGRDALAGVLKETAERRRRLAERVDIEELWEVLHEEQEWIDLDTMTDLCFPGAVDDDHRSAAARAFFDNRVYFKFNSDRYFPHTPEQVDAIQAQEREAARRQRVIEAGGDWLARALKGGTPSPEAFTPEQAEWVEIIRSVYLLEKESPHWDLGKAMLARAGVDMGDPVFRLLVALGAWSPDENVELYRFDVPVEFPNVVVDRTADLVRSGSAIDMDGVRRDLTGLELMTIDGQYTLDFDDALSIRDMGNHCELGVHIADVSHFIRRDDPIDREAIARGSSIYMPDQKIPMLPQTLAEDLCSLKAGELRPAVSILIRIDREAEILGYEIVPSAIRVAHQLSYFDANMMAEGNPDIMLLHAIARKYRQKRLADGAVQITLPELNIWLGEDGTPVVNRTNRESPGRLLVSEIMIMANALMARFLAEKEIPAVFRSQPAPRDRLYKDSEGTLFQNWMQRKFLSRFALGPGPERHSGLGVDAYVTATSPIRKYFDLITQRQIRSAFGLETPYTQEEVSLAIGALEAPMTAVSRLQFRRKRYWLLKYLEGRVGEKEEALVLARRKSDYLALLPEYMIECAIPFSSGLALKPENVTQVTLQHVDARRDVLTVFAA